MIPNPSSYTFSTGGSLTDSQTVQSVNVFKKSLGFAGMVKKPNGDPAPGVKVEIYSPTNTLVATVLTDADG